MDLNRNIVKISREKDSDLKILKDEIDENYSFKYVSIIYFHNFY